MKLAMRVSLAAFVLGLAAVSAWAQVMPQPFSSDMAITSKNGEKMNGKFYFARPKLRMDMSSRGHDTIVITNRATQVSDVLMPQQHMYMEMHAGQNNPMMPNIPKVDIPIDPSNPCASRQDVTCKNLGTETVNGRVCDHWQMTDKKSGVTNTWIDQKLHFPIKTESADGSLMEFTNVKEGAPAASLFEVPADYRKFDMPAGMMGGRPPQ